MSVTFSCNDVAYEEYKPYEDDEDDELAAYVTQKPVAPFFEINMSNGNAIEMLRTLLPNEQVEYYGRWEYQELPYILAKATLLLHSDAGVLALVEPSRMSGNFTECGRDATYVKLRLEQFCKLFALAIQHGKSVSWG